MEAASTASALPSAMAAYRCSGEPAPPAAGTGTGTAPRPRAPPPPPPRARPDGRAAAAAAVGVHLPAEAGTAPAARPFGVDGDDDALRPELLRGFRHERRILHGGGVDRHLVRPP